MEENNKNCCLNFLNYLDNFWIEYKHHSGKISIILSILGGISSILVGMNMLAGSIALAVTNVSIFMSGIAYEKLTYENRQLNDDCISQKQMLRRYTAFINPTDINNTNDPFKEDSITIRSNDSLETIKPVDFEQLHLNNTNNAFNMPHCN